MIEYWSPETLSPVASSSPAISFKFKSDTDLYALAKAKTYPTSIKVSPNGKQFVLMSKDKQIRVFDLRSGKLKLQIDESAQSYMVSRPASMNERINLIHVLILYNPHTNFTTEFYDIFSREEGTAKASAAFTTNTNWDDDWRRSVSWSRWTK